ncbi:DUF1186 domain-containing protein [Chloroflexota bacterium]
MKEIIEHFKSLSDQEISAQRPGKWADSGLLDVLRYFDEQKDYERAATITELILRSPENSEMVAYSELYFEIIQAERGTENYSAALGWAHAAMAYEEQHEPGLNRINGYRDLAEIYLSAEDFNIGLAILTRCLIAVPTDVWTFNILGLTLPHVGLSDLAVEVFDRGLQLVAKSDPEGLRDQFERLHKEAEEKAVDAPSRLQEIDSTVLADFREAMQFTTGHPDSINAYLPPIDQLIIAEDDTGTLYANIVAQGKVLAPDLIRMAFDEDLSDTPASGHAIAILRQLQASETVELKELKHWLDRADGYWQMELLTNAMGKIGGYTTAELEVIAADTSYDLYVRSGAIDALTERAQRRPAQRERIVNFMQMLLTRPEASKLATEEAFIGFLISDILDLEARELYPEIEAAYQEDYVDTAIMDLAFVQEKWGLPVSSLFKRRDDGLYLRLRCIECEREREHFVQHVTVDLGTEKEKDAGKSVEYDSHVMDREIICPKCGARDRYELTPQASMRLMVPTDGLESFAALIRGDHDKPKFEPHPRAHYFESVVFGLPMHPLVGLDKYKELIAAKPKDVALRIRMGNLFRTLHRYPQALESFRKGYELGTDNPEFVLIRAMAEHDFGDQTMAKKLYEETITSASIKQIIRDPDISNIVETARRGLKLLKRGKASPWEPEIIGGKRAAKKTSSSSPVHRKKRIRAKSKSKGKRKKRKGRN